ncbi:MAG: Spore coat F-containing protein [Hydrogenibacillus schlegelii]|uniref:Spore coat F-containing protein n=1 Tax=Hydrogenibacillus schlegelii TaxID=1484 RepID=A0A2T5G9W2_HYDSH|nr:spore coat protein [Hydrogenibacillus schlegelii]PTQ52967.1 MAG: Spore coat F-containing protein [Hydrogenibacillus schlegelii]
MAQARTTISPPAPAESPSPAMNDRDIANALLALEKSLTSGLNIAAWEASNDALHQDLMNMLQDSHQAVRRIYNFMFAQGWYPIDVEDQAKVDEAFSQFDQKLKGELPPQGMLQ